MRLMSKKSVSTAEAAGDGGHLGLLHRKGVGHSARGADLWLDTSQVQAALDDPDRFHLLIVASTRTGQPRIIAAAVADRATRCQRGWRSAARRLRYRRSTAIDPAMPAATRTNPLMALDQRSGHGRNAIWVNEPRQIGSRTAPAGTTSLANSPSVSLRRAVAPTTPNGAPITTAAANQTRLSDHTDESN